MNKSYRKLVTRGIKGSLTRFLSILGIVALGAGFLAGLLATSPDMKATGDKYYLDQNTYDIQVQSNLGLTEDDITYLQGLDQVDKVTATYQLDILTLGGEEKAITTRVIGQDFTDQSRVNNLVLVEGRMAQRPDECVVVVPDQFMYQEKIGQVITIDKKNKDYQDLLDKFVTDQFTIVGIVESSQFLSAHGEISNVGSGKIYMAMYLQKEAFNNPEVYHVAYMTLKNKEGISSFSKEYDELIKLAKENMEVVGKERAAIRTEEIKGEARDKLAQAQDDFNKAKAEVETKLADGQREIDNGFEQIRQGRIDIANGYSQLKAGEDNLNVQEQQLLMAKGEIDNLKAMVAQGAVLPPEVMAQIVQYDQGVLAIAEGKKEIEATRSVLDSKNYELETGEARLVSSQWTLDRERMSANEQLDEAQEKIDDGQKKLDQIPEGKWYVTNRNDNVGMYNYKSDIEKIGAVAKVFPVFFFIIALLVASTTMTRMIEEERGQIGVMKSLGYSDWDVLKYYLIYSFSATVIGSIIGLSVGLVLLPKVISNAYTMMYNMPTAEPKFLWYITLPVVLVIILGIMVTTYLACLGEMREKPANLLINKAPKNGKRIWLERITPIWKRIRFTRKVTLRNLFRYKKRFLMTIVGISGCFALILAGFGIKDSIGDIVNRQYQDIFKSDYTVEVMDPEDITLDQVISSTLEDKSLVDDYSVFHSSPIKVIKDNKSDKSTAIVFMNQGEMTNFIGLQESKTGKKIDFKDDSVVITDKTAELLKVKKGDTITVRSDKGVEGHVTVTDITENYVGSYTYMSQGKYEEVFKETPEYKDIYIKSSNKDVTSTLLKSDNIKYLLSAETLKVGFDSSVASINYIVLVLIGAAGALAIIVLYNLTNVNICERKRELATIKVLGFFEKEVSDYIFREINILSGIGMAVGVPLGVILHKFIMRTIEVSEVMFGREIYWQSYVYSILITTLFTIVVNLIMRKSIREIDMVESMKAND